MSLDSLPFMVFLLLVEYGTGGTLVLYAVQRRGLVTSGFLRTGAATLVAADLLALWVGATLGRPADVGGYTLADGFLTPALVLLAVLLGCALLYTAALWREQERFARAAGALACAVAIVALALAAAVFRDPAWSYVGVLLSLLAGGLSLGAVTFGMVLGHWYLVTPRLPSRPLVELSLGLVALLALQSLLLVLNLAVPVHQVPDPAAGGSHLLQDPAFWLRIGVGLAFPLVLGLMSWRAALEHGMMSATGLLYIATGAVLAGEALARGLQFSTGVPF